MSIRIVVRAAGTPRDGSPAYERRTDNFVTSYRWSRADGTRKRVGTFRSERSRDGNALLEIEAKVRQT